MSFKSGVVHDQIAVTDKESALAMMDTLKTNSGLFEMDKADSYIAPHFCSFEPTGELMVVKDAANNPVRVRSYTVTSKSLSGKYEMKIRHLMGCCKDCGKTKMMTESASA